VLRPDVERIELALDGVDGLSGLTADDQGMLWAVPEEARFLIQIDPENGATERRPLSGCPDALELEALTWISGSRFAAGTESGVEGRSEDALLILDLAGEAVTSQPSVECPYQELWSMHGESNRGIEGLCYVDGSFIVASEIVAEIEGARYAPIGLYHRATERWVGYRLRLTSSTGKISALACRAEADGTHVLAVERHFGVSRLLRFVVPLEGEGGMLTPEMVLDLNTVMDGEDLNFEGLAFTADGRLALITDNLWHERTGPNVLVMLAPSLWSAP